MHVCVLVVKSVCLGLPRLVGRHVGRQVFGTDVCLWAWKVVFAGDPTSLARNNIVWPIDDGSGLIFCLV